MLTSRAQVTITPSVNAEPAVAATAAEPSDGIGEVFAVQGGFDAYQYVIFKKIGGRWRQVYDTIGDAC